MREILMWNYLQKTFLADLGMGPKKITFKSKTQEAPHSDFVPEYHVLISPLETDLGVKRLNQTVFHLSYRNRFYARLFQLLFFSISSPWLRNSFNFEVLKWFIMTNFNFDFSAYHHHGWRIFSILKFWNGVEWPISTSIFQHIITMVEEFVQFWSFEVLK